MNSTQHSSRWGSVVGLVTVLGAASACMHPVSSSGANMVRNSAARHAQGPYALAGQHFSVTLDQPIDTMESLHHGTFTAHLETPITGADGTVLAAPGAHVTGHISSLGTVEYPQIRVHFDSIETVHGPTRLSASLGRAQYRQYPGPTVYGSAPGAWGGGPYYGGWRGVSWNGWDGYWDYFPYRPAEVHMPAGSRMELTLMRPLMAPTTISTTPAPRTP